MAEHFLPATYEKVNSTLRRKAEIELNENESRMQFELEQLRKMIEQNQVPSRTDNDFLLWFLRSKKHDLKRAFEQLQKYSFQRHNLMAYYGFIDFHKIRVPIEEGICGILPRRDAEGRIIIFVRACKWQPSLCAADDVLRSMQALIHFCLEFPATQISGFCFICDNYLASFDTLHLFVKYATAFAPTITAFPGRFQLIAIVNTNIILRGLSPLLLSLMPAKLKKRTSFYGDVKDCLPKIFDPSILPEEFGGTLGPVTSLYHSWINDLKQFVPKLHATNKYFKRKNTVHFPEDEEAWTAFCQ